MASTHKAPRSCELCNIRDGLFKISVQHGNAKKWTVQKDSVHVWQLQLYIEIGAHGCLHVQIAEALTHIAGGKLPQAVVEVVEVAEVVEVEASQVAALVAAAAS